MPGWQENQICDAENDELRVVFDRRLTLRFCARKIITAAELLANRGLSKALN